MEEIYGMGSSVDFSDHTGIGSSVSPESFVCFPQFVSSYCTYYSPPPAGGFGDKISSSLDDIVGLMPPVASVLDSSSSPYFSGDGEGRTFYTSEISSAIKAKIASHPRYPSLVEAYIDCRKVGAPPEIASVLEEIRRESDALKGNSIASCLGVDPELDEFMESYFEILVKYKADLTKPFEEATMFLNKIERQLRNLCNGTTPSGNCPSSADEHAGSSNDDELSGGEVEAQNSSVHCPEHDLKEKLLRKYSGYLGSLKREFSKKKKKGKLPKEGRQTLLEWWNSHYKWPYPTEADKISLAESTGLDQKQINNWFINQRKRHWKPSENVQFSAIESLSMPFYDED